MSTARDGDCASHAAVDGGCAAGDEGASATGAGRATGTSDETGAGAAKVGDGSFQHRRPQRLHMGTREGEKRAREGVHAGEAQASG